MLASELKVDPLIWNPPFQSLSNLNVKKALRKMFWHFLPQIFWCFHKYNHMVFLVPFRINLHLWVFRKLTHANKFQIELKTVWLFIHKRQCASLRIGNLHLNLQIKSQNKLLRNMLCKLSRKFLGLLELQLEVDNRELVVHFEHKSIQQQSWKILCSLQHNTIVEYYSVILPPAPEMLIIVSELLE